jgi:serine/threonine protein kinase
MSGKVDFSWPSGCMSLPRPLPEPEYRPIISLDKEFVGEPCDPSEEVIERVNEYFKNFCDLSKEVIGKVSKEVNRVLGDDGLLKQILYIRSGLSNKEVIESHASDAFPCLLIITRKFFQVLLKRIGEGTDSEVFKGPCFFFEPIQRGSNQPPCSPSTSKDMVLKRGKKGKHFSPEAKKLKRVTSSGARTGTDYPILTARSAVTGYSLHELYLGSLRSVQYADVNNPAMILTQILLGCVEGLCKTHKTGMVHRDVKGDNILVERQGNGEASGVMTDHNLLTPEKKTRHRTTGTSIYLDPALFGSPKSSLVNQKARVGLQTKEADMFAFGRTIERDGLLRIFAQLAEKYKIQDLISDLMEEIKPKGAKVSENGLYTLGDHYPHLVNFISSKNGVAQICIFKKLEERIGLIHMAIDRFKNYLDPKDFDILHRLASLAYNLQSPDTRPTAEETKQKLSAIISRQEGSSRKREGGSEEKDCARKRLKF